MLYLWALLAAVIGWFIHPMLTFVILLSIGDAHVELQTEVDSKNPQPETGWAKNLPCWRAEKDAWHYKIWKIIMGPHKPMTGYHAWRIPTLIFFFHLPFFLLPGTWTGARECATMFWFLLYGNVEDYLWFYFHPCYGPRKFITEGRSGRIWWTPVFWGPFPKDYYMAIPPLAALAFFAWR